MGDYTIRPHEAPSPSYEISEKTLKKLKTLTDLSHQFIRLEKGEAGQTIIKIDNAFTYAQKSLAGERYITPENAQRQILFAKAPKGQEAAMEKLKSLCFLELGKLDKTIPTTRGYAQAFVQHFHDQGLITALKEKGKNDDIAVYKMLMELGIESHRGKIDPDKLAANVAKAHGLSDIPTLLAINDRIKLAVDTKSNEAWSHALNPPKNVGRSLGEMAREQRKHLQ